MIRHDISTRAYNQAQSCLTSIVGNFAIDAGMSSIESDHHLIVALIRWADTNPNQVAKAIGVANTTINRHFKGTSQSRLSATVLEKLKETYPAFPGFGGGQIEESTYVSVSVLPSYAGMGGGGTGDGDPALAKLPRRLIEEDLRGKAKDFELIDVRGDSMMPDFQHGDQILVDRRDRDPLQPGPFALWDGDGYVVKLIERIPQRRGWYRVFSANARYSPYDVSEEDVRIMGRPVWFARRL